MYVVMDLCLRDLSLIAQREVSGIPRWYYTVRGYGSLLLVTHGASAEGWQGKRGIALFGVPDSTIVCDVLPGAPERWRHQKILQCTLKAVPRVKGRPRSLGRVLAERVSTCGKQQKQSKEV